MGERRAVKLELRNEEAKEGDLDAEFVEALHRMCTIERLPAIEAIEAAIFAGYLRIGP